MQRGSILPADMQMSSENVLTSNISAKQALLHILSVFDTVFILDKFSSISVTTQSLCHRLCEELVEQLSHRRFQKSLYNFLCAAIEFLVGWFFSVTLQILQNGSLFGKSVGGDDGLPLFTMDPGPFLV